MIKYRLRLVCIIPALCMIFLFSGCGALNDLASDVYRSIFGDDEEEKRPAELMIEGTENLDKGKYQAATDAFQEIKDKYPYSQYAVLAELRMADGLFKQGQYEAAYEAYDEFEKLHPTNKLIPYAIYQKGECYFQRLSTVDRDQTPTMRAKEEFERLINRYPNSEYAKKARKAIRKCLIYLAEYEMYVGRYYFKKGKYRAALGRFSYIIKNYPDMGQYHEAMEYITRCREKLDQEEADEEVEAREEEEVIDQDLLKRKKEKKEEEEKRPKEEKQKGPEENDEAVPEPSDKT